LLLFILAYKLTFKYVFKSASCTIVYLIIGNPISFMNWYVNEFAVTMCKVTRCPLMQKKRRQYDSLERKCHLKSQEVMSTSRDLLAL